MVSKFAESTTGSSVVEFRHMADALEAKGITIVDFGIGEPDFEAAPIVNKALIDSIRSGRGSMSTRLDCRVCGRRLLHSRKANTASVPIPAKLLSRRVPLVHCRTASRALLIPAMKFYCLSPAMAHTAISD